MSGIFRFVVKSDIPGYNLQFLPIFEFAIIFHLKNYLLGVVISAQPHMCDCTVIFYILTLCINTMGLKSQKKNIKSK